MKSVAYVALSALALCGCEPAATSGAAAASSIPMCVAPVRKEVAFIAPGAKDVLEFAAIGKDCAHSTILATVRTADGKLLWSHADTAADTFAFAIDQENPEQGVRKLMEQWAEQASLSTSAEAPDWKEGAERPENETGLWFGTEFPREEYLRERAAARPMLCHPILMNRQACILYMGSDYAAKFYELSS
jgi:hypothetical protein